MRVTIIVITLLSWLSFSAIFLAADLIIGSVAGLLLGILFFFIGRGAIRAQNRIKAEKEEKRRSVARAETPAFSAKVKHVSGLPAAQGVEGRLDVYVNRTEIVMSGSTYHVDASQIKGAEAITEEQIRQYNKMSVSRVIAGGLLFGPIGAIIGGMPRTTDKKVANSTFLVINYKSSAGEGTFLLFELLEYQAKQGANIICQYAGLTENGRIEL